MNKNLVLTGLLSLLLSGCAVDKDSLKATLDKNPEILFQVLEKNPTQFAQVMQKVEGEARKLAQGQYEEEEKKRLEGEFNNPKNPVIAENRAVRGNRNAPIKLVVYSDFECPFCSRGKQTVDELKKKYGSKMMYVYKHLPLPFHSHAMPAAKWFEAIALQDAEKAYKFHDLVFSNQKGLAGGEKFLEQTAKKVGADVAKAKKDTESDEVKKRIQADTAEAEKFEISGTPGFIISGITLKGAYPVAKFDEIIQKRGVASQAE